MVPQSLGDPFCYVLALAAKISGDGYNRHVSISFLILVDDHKFVAYNSGLAGLIDSYTLNNVSIYCISELSAVSIHAIGDVCSATGGGPGFCEAGDILVLVAEEQGLEELFAYAIRRMMNNKHKFFFMQISINLIELLHRS